MKDNDRRFTRNCFKIGSGTTYTLLILSHYCKENMIDAQTGIEMKSMSTDHPDTKVFVMCSLSHFSMDGQLRNTRSGWRMWIRERRLSLLRSVVLDGLRNSRITKWCVVDRVQRIFVGFFVLQNNLLVLILLFMILFYAINAGFFLIIFNLTNVNLVITS